MQSYIYCDDCDSKSLRGSAEPIGGATIDPSDPITLAKAIESSCEADSVLAPCRPPDSMRRFMSCRSSRKRDTKIAVMLCRGKGTIRLHAITEEVPSSGTQERVRTVR